MAVSILHLPDQFYFGRQFCALAIQMLVDRIGKGLFEKFSTELELTKSNGQFQDNTNIDEIIDLLEDPLKQVNSICLMGFPEAGKEKYSILLFLNDHQLGNEASFSISSPSPEWNMQAGEFISELFAKILDELASASDSPLFQWKTNGNQLLADCWGIAGLKKALENSVCAQRQSQHYFISPVLEFELSSISAWKLVELSWITVMEFMNPAKAKAEIIEYPFAERHTYISRNLLLLILMKGENRNRSFRFVENTDENSSQKDYIRLDLWFDQTPESSGKMSVRVRCRSASPVKASKMERHFLETLFLFAERQYLQKPHSEFNLLQRIDKISLVNLELWGKHDLEKDIHPKSYSDFLLKFSKSFRRKGRSYFELITSNDDTFVFENETEDRMQEVLRRWEYKTFKVHKFAPSGFSLILSLDKGQFSDAAPSPFVEYLVMTGSNLQNKIVRNRLIKKLGDFEAKQKKEKIRPNENTWLLSEKDSSLVDSRSLTLKRISAKEVTSFLRSFSGLSANGESDTRIYTFDFNGNIELLTTNSISLFLIKNPGLKDLVQLTFSNQENVNRFLSASFFPNSNPEIFLLAINQEEEFKSLVNRGKKIVAQINHGNSKKKTKSKIRVDCAFKPDPELFRKPMSPFIESLDNCFISSPDIQIYLLTRYKKVFQFGLTEIPQLDTTLKLEPVTRIALFYGNPNSPNFLKLSIRSDRQSWPISLDKVEYSLISHYSDQMERIEETILRYLGYPGQPLKLEYNFRMSMKPNKIKIRGSFQGLKKFTGENSSISIMRFVENDLAGEKVRLEDKVQESELFKKLNFESDRLLISAEVNSPDDVALEIELDCRDTITDPFCRINLTSNNLSKILNSRNFLIEKWKLGEKWRVGSKGSAKLPVTRNFSFPFPVNPENFGRIRSILNKFFSEIDHFFDIESIKIDLLKGNGQWLENRLPNRLNKRLFGKLEIELVRFKSRMIKGTRFIVDFNIKIPGPWNGKFTVISNSNTITKKVLQFFREEFPG